MATDEVAYSGTEVSVGGEGYGASWLEEVFLFLEEAKGEAEATFFAKEAPPRVFTIAINQLREKKSKYLENKKIKVREWWSENNG